MRSTAAEAAAYEGEVDRRIAARLAGKAADKTLPEATALDLGPRVLVDLRDPSGDRLRVETDDRDGRGYIVLGEPDDERVFEVGSQAHREAICGAIGRLAVGGGARDAEPVQQASAAVKHGSANGRPMSLEDTARASLVAQVVSLAGALPSEDLHALAARLEGRTAALSWGERMRLRGRRASVTRSAEVGGTKVHVGTAADEAGEIREVWIDVAKEGSPVRGLLHAVAGLASIALQHGAPPAAVAKVMSEPAFEPAGQVKGVEEDGITSARSIPHYVAQVLTLGGGR